jgi:FAD/FMN-containing dehydrogenase
VLAEALARARLEGPVVEPGHREYEGLRRVYNDIIERRPGAIVRAASVADVQKAVGIAAETALPLAIRCGGHSFAGLGTCDDGIVCDLSRLNRVAVDPLTRTVEVGGGALLGDVDAAGEPFGLVTPAGVVSHTGVGGLTLGGGMGWLSRRFGLTVDNLLEVELVTADSRVSRVAPDVSPELFWAIRGGGGNFGVVTRFTFRMHELGPAATRHWTSPSSTAAEALRRYRAAADELPRQVTTAFVVSDVELSLRAIGSGPVGGAVLDKLAPSGGIEDRARLTFRQLQCVADEALPWGLRYYSKGGFLAALDDRAIDVITDAIREIPVPGLEVYCIQLGGAVSDVEEDATAYSGRAAGFYWISQGAWSRPEDDEPAIAWCRRTARHLGDLSMATNYVNEQADTGIAENAYGAAKYRRLRELKGRHDPTNVFRLNQNIDPIRP